MIANIFCILDLVYVIIAVFPVPFPGSSLVIFGYRHGPRNIREFNRLIHLLATPEYTRAHYAVIGFLRAPQLAVLVPSFPELVTRLAAVAIIGAGPVPDPAIACCINKNRCRKPSPDARFQFNGIYRSDFITFCMNVINAVA